MKTRIVVSLTAFVASLACGVAFAGDDSHASRAIKEGIRASGHASASAGHSIGASGRVTSAVMAVPLSIGAVTLGSAAVVSGAAARDSMKAATAPIGTPLEIGDESVTVMPPNEALKGKDNAKQTKL